MAAGVGQSTEAAVQPVAQQLGLEATVVDFQDPFRCFQVTLHSPGRLVTSHCPQQDEDESAY